MRVAGRLIVEFRTNLSLGVVALALLLSFGLTALLAVMSRVGPDHLYGGPIPVGRSDLDILAGGPNPTFVPLLFVVDVVITLLVLLFVARRGGVWGVLGASGGGLLALLIAFLMYARSMHTVGAPLPAPLDRAVIPPALIIWIDMAFWASVVVFVAGRLIARLPLARYLPDRAS